MPLPSLWERVLMEAAYLSFHLQAYEKREETRLGDDHPEALVITVQTNECLGIGGYLQSNGQQIFFQHFFLTAVQRILEGNRNLPLARIEK